MFFLVFRLLINTLLISLTVLLLPGLEIQNASLLWYLFFGALFGLINTFVRPFVIFATGRYVIRTLGLFMVVINSFMLALVSWLSPIEWDVNNIFTVLLAGAIIGILSALFDAVLGLNRPILDEIESGDSYWRWFSKLPAGGRNTLVENMRFQQVYDTIWRYGLDISLAKTPLEPIREYIGRLFFPDAHTMDDVSAPAQVRLMLQELGPTYVKLGQMVSSRSEALPAEWQIELAKLQSNVAPFPSAEAIVVVEEETGQSINDVFLEFQFEPLAAASTAQVHEAVMFDGAHVAVKVQRPLIIPKVQADLGIMQDAVETMEKRFEWARNTDMSGIFSVFAKNIMEELDYTNEAYRATRLKFAMADLEGIRVPSIYLEASTTKILTMDFVSGVKITNVEAIDAAGFDRKQLAKTFLRAMIKQILVDGFFHGDPHPGNVMIDTENGDVVFLDMGMMGYLNSDDRMALIDLIWAIRDVDAHELANVMMQLSTPFKPFDEKEFREQMEQMVNRYMVYDTSGSGGGLGNVMTAALDKMYDAGLRMRGDLTLAIKALMQAEEIVYTLDPAPMLIDTAFTQVRELMVQQFSVDSVTKSLKTQAVRTGKEVIRRMPTLQEATLKWLDQYEAGKFQLVVDTESLNTKLDGVQVVGERLAIGMILVGMIIGAAVSMTLDTSFLGIPMSTIGFILLIVAVSIGIKQVWDMSSDIKERSKNDLE
jgi:ubiquinone biosynthesis protein